MAGPGTGWKTVHLLYIIHENNGKCKCFYKKEKTKRGGDVGNDVGNDMGDDVGNF